MQIFNEIFKRTSLRIVSGLRSRGGQLHAPPNIAAVLRLLQCQRSLCANVQMPLSVELVDDVLAFLSEINIKACAIVDSGRRFGRLHAAMADVALALVQHRHFFIVDRVPQFGGVVGDLLQSLAFYKTTTMVAAKNGSAANVPTAVEMEQLNGGEVTMLADLAHRIER